MHLAGRVVEEEHGHPAYTFSQKHLALDMIGHSAQQGIPVTPLGEGSGLPYMYVLHIAPMGLGQPKDLACTGNEQ